ncbi:cytochrome c [Azospirillum sp.]|uniref:c-type cytochrome n=1 Tax=Azospirillum sp. TaxID=34012 RepID=UPI002D2E2FB1|nr:cytochrome c [Azospirillum sp.]HYD65483.1 cytochrome c [Azospirillum sp.]
MSRLRNAVLAALLAACSPALAGQSTQIGIGTPLTPEEIARWDIAVRPDGRGLPPGSGTAKQGDPIYQEKCAACHGEFGEGAGRWPQLVGGQGTLTSDNPAKTPGSYWPYATTLFDYIRRAMPFGAGQSLSNDEVYAITAYLLAEEGIIAADAVVDARSLPAIAMPNRDGFIDDPRPDVPKAAVVELCMTNCAEKVTITGHARKIDVTPDRQAAARGE